jgi:hypothetical protein
MDDSRTFWLTQAIKNHPKSQNPKIPKSQNLKTLQNPGFSPPGRANSPAAAHKTKKPLRLKENSRLTQPERVCTTGSNARLLTRRAKREQ